MAVPLFAATIFFGAFLMFLVEPMVARMVLPVLGGAPMVWNTCVMFFQIMLLAGYASAHGTTAWLGSRRQTIAYAILLVMPLAVLPFAIGGAAHAPPIERSPLVWLLVALVSAIGLPFFVLATSSSMLQVLFSRTDHPAAADPYFLYMASNLGSLLALVAYPALVEPTLRLRDQSRVWTAGYGIFVVLALASLLLASRRPAPSAVAAAPARAAPSTVGASPAWRRARWIVLAFIPSSLMLAVTSYLSTDIAAVPLLWIVPLAVYLLTFVLAFSSRSATYRTIANRRLPLVVVALAVFIIIHAGAPLWLVPPLHLLAFAMAAVLCHGELAADRPPPALLTEFYFWIAFGGMLGGVFNTLLAPMLFRTVLEYPLVLVLACFFRRPVGPPRESPRRRALDVAVPLGIAGLTAALILFAHRFGSTPRLALFLPALLCFSQLKRPLRFALCVGALLLVGLLVPGANSDGEVLHGERTFFGVYRVSLDPSGRYHTLFHGTTLHGMEAVDRARRGEPLSYFHRNGPFGQAFAELPSASAVPEVAVVGLGVGSLASYARPEQHWTFYEIDPAVEGIARRAEYFTFLQSCGGRCRVVLGDARLALARARPNQYGLIVLDAFSSDAIPVHLMTSEAFSLYLSRLAPDGALAFHISNRHLSLGPVVARLALNHGLAIVEQTDILPTDMSPDGRASSNWVVMARDRRLLGGLTEDSRWAVPGVPASAQLWTDDFSNILSVLKMR